VSVPEENVHGPTNFEVGSPLPPQDGASVKHRSPVRTKRRRAEPDEAGSLEDMARMLPKFRPGSDILRAP
jgi:hypothetical protein